MEIELAYLDAVFLWQLPLMAQWPQLHPQADFPLFLSLTSFLIINTVIKIRTAITTIFPKLSTR